jgi:hypothetical protein
VTSAVCEHLVLVLHVGPHTQTADKLASKAKVGAASIAPFFEEALSDEMGDDSSCKQNCGQAESNPTDDGGHRMARTTPALVALASLLAGCAIADDKKPTIGVLTTPLDGGPCETLNGQSAAHMAESAGAAA